MCWRSFFLGELKFHGEVFQGGVGWDVNTDTFKPYFQQ